MNRSHDRGGARENAASNVTPTSPMIVQPTGCLCGHFYDEDCIRHLPVDGTGARYKAAQKRAA